MILVGCGGSTAHQDEDPLVNPSSIDKTQSVTAISIAGKQVTVESFQYLNLEPQVIVSGKNAGCNNLIVTAYFSSDYKPFPGGLTIDSVMLLQENSVVWSGDISKSETKLEAGSLFAISRGCPPRGLQSGAMLEAVFKVTYQNSTYLLRAPITSLGEAE